MISCSIINNSNLKGAYININTILIPNFGVGYINPFLPFRLVKIISIIKYTTLMYFLITSIHVYLSLSLLLWPSLLDGLIFSLFLNSAHKGLHCICPINLNKFSLILFSIEATSCRCSHFLFGLVVYYPSSILTFK